MELEHVYDGMYREIFNEIDSQRPFADLRAWLEQVAVSVRQR